MTDPKTRILVIDDDPMIRQLFVSFLKIWGYTALEAVNGQEGLDIFDRQDVDLVLTDLDMPVKTGLEVLAELHERSPDTPVVIISGAGQLDDAVQSVKLGAWDYLTKPISNMAILENTVMRCLEKVRLLRENKRYQEHLENEVAKKTDELRKKNIALEQEVAERKSKEEEVRHINNHLLSIIDASGELFQYTTVRDLLAGVLATINRILRGAKTAAAEENRTEADAFAALTNNDGTRLICGLGKYADSDESLPSAVIPPQLYGRTMQVLNSKSSEFGNREFLGYIGTVNRMDCVLYLGDCPELSDPDFYLLQIYLNNIASALDSIVLQEEIVATQKEVVITLGEVIETRSNETANHVRRVAEYSYLLAREYGLDDKDATLLRFASPMHDAGKIGIPDSILNKPGKLTLDEVDVIHEHTKMGFDILKRSQREILKMAAIVAYEHHERWDGTGYPQGLAGEQIHIFGRIVALADVFDALGSNRCYKKAWPLEEILILIKQKRGIYFDPKLVDILFEQMPRMMEIRERFPDN